MIIGFKDKETEKVYHQSFSKTLFTVYTKISSS